MRASSPTDCRQPTQSRDDEPEPTMPWPCPTCLDIRAARDARVSFPIAVIALLLTVWLGGNTAQAQLLLLPEDPGPRAFPVSRLELSYSESSWTSRADRPALQGLVPLRVELQETEDGWAAPRPGESSTPPPR